MRHTLCLFLIALMLPTALLAQDGYDDEPEANRQYVSWGVTAGPNISGYRIGLHDIEGHSVQPSFGFGADAFLEYHISDPWRLRLDVGPSIDHVIVDRSNKAAICVDVALPVILRLPTPRRCAWVIGAGPYSHFDAIGNNAPMTIVGSDQQADNFNSGLAILVAYETPSHWQLQAVCHWGMTNLLNSESHNGYILPYKIAFSIGHHFQ